MLLLLQRIIRCGSSLHLNLLRLNLERLLHLRGCDKLTRHDDCRADVQLLHFLKVLQHIGKYHLHRLKERTVIDNDKTEILGITKTSDPSADGHCRIQILILAAK